MRILAMQLGKLGVWSAMDLLTAADGAAFAQRVEGWGYAALWLPESRGRNVLVHSSWLLANTRTLIIAPGIANISPATRWRWRTGSVPWPSSRAAAFCSASAFRTCPRSR